MRGHLEGTGHSILLDRREPAIYDAIRRTIGVSKVEPGRVAWTGPSPPRLRIRAALSPHLVEAWLYIACGRRRLFIGVDQGYALDRLVAGLGATLAKWDIEVETLATARPSREEETEVNETPRRTDRMPTESEIWAFCVQIHEEVKLVKELDDQELLLEIQLEELRGKKKAAQERGVQTLGALLRP